MLRRLRWLLVPVLGAGLTVSAGALAFAPSVQASVSPTCLTGTVGACGYNVSVNANGSLAITVGTGVAYDGDEDMLIGVANNSGGYVPSISLAGTNAFAFDGDGLCTRTGHPTGCPFGGTGYEGPGTTFVNTTAGAGTVNFTTALAPGTTAYFSLEGVPTTGSAIVVTPAAVQPQTTAVAFTTPIANIADGNHSDTAASFTATVNWADGSGLDSSPVVTGSAGVFTVTGSHTYAAHNTYLPLVTVKTATGATASVTDSIAVADDVAKCNGGSCSTDLTSNGVDLTASTTTNTPGDLLFSTDPNAGNTAVNCGDPYRHSPRTIEESDTFATGASSITQVISFPKKDGTPGGGPAYGNFFWICYHSSHTFTDLEGQVVSIGLLPVCTSASDVRPCLNYVEPGPHNTIVEEVTYPVGDPQMG